MAFGASRYDLSRLGSALVQSYLSAIASSLRLDRPKDTWPGLARTHRCFSPFRIP